ncbi:fibronectin type III domain-containing protein [Microbacterium sp. LWH11-1.2]|uniref:fibronectin type III domain-containing protein n=1 Tax=Microbacterium sp. LWH11-1.2 TaxID=3135258 RepID=UPI0031387E3A
MPAFSRTAASALSAVLLAGLLTAPPAIAAPPPVVAATGAVAEAGRQDPVGLDLIVNGGFEQASDTAAQEWTSSSAAATTFTGESHSGQRALSISWASADAPANRGVTSSPVAVHASRIKSVRLSGWVKLVDVLKGPNADSTGKVFINFRKADGTSNGWFGTGGLTGTTDGWQQIDQVIAVPANTTHAVISVALDRATGTMLADEIALTPASWNNLVPNPGFELVNTNPATNVLSPAQSWFTPWQSGTYALDDTVASEGIRSMRVDGIATPAAGTPAGGGASIGKIGAAVTVSGVDAAKWPLLRVSARVRLSEVAIADYAAFPGAARVALNFSYVKDGTTVYTGSGILGGVKEGDTDGWTTVSGTFRVPPLTTRLTVVPSVQTATGTFWVDDVRATPEVSTIAPAEQVKATAGGPTDHIVTVTNTTGTAQAFRVVPDAVGASATTTTATTEPLQPGQSQTVTVTVAPDDGVEEANVRLHVLPTTGTTGAETALITTVVRSASAVTGDPRVFSTPAQLSALRDRVGGQAWAGPAFDKILANADAWLDVPLDQPVLHGGWSGNFKCPGSNTSLTWDPDSPTRHLCPTTGAFVEGDALVDKGWIEIWHNNAAIAAADLGLASRVLADSDPRVEQYVAKARDILRYYADRYPSIPMNSLYGKVHYQSLDEAVSLLSLTDAYDLLRGRLDAADRVEIEENLLRPVAEMLISIPTATSNFQAWTTAAVYAVGAAIDDPSLRDWAMNDPQEGARFLLDKAVLSDGWWWEGSASYHLYALQALTQLAIAAKNIGEADLPAEPRFRAMHFAILPYLYPDMTIPASGDGGNWGRQYGPNSTMFAEWAYGQYRDPEFAVGLHHAYGSLGTPRTDAWALRYGADEIPASTGSRQGSATFSGLGETILRSHAAASLLDNGDLEEAALDSSVTPRSWTLEGAAWTPDGFLGTKGLMLVSGQSASAELRVDGRAVDALRLRAQVAADQTTEARVTADFVDDRGRAAGSQSIDIAPTGDWRPLDAVLEIPEGTRTVDLTVTTGGGTLRIDRVDVWDDDLVPDGGFESDAAGWSATGDATVVKDAQRGEGAANLVGSAEPALFSTDVPAVGSRVHTMRLDAVVDTGDLTGDAAIEVGFLKADGEVVPGPAIELDHAEGWTPVGTDITLPQDALAVRVGIRVAAHAGELRVDDVSVIPVDAVDATQVNAIRLDHGVPGGTHGHADKLHVDVVGGGALSSTDLGQVYGVSNADLTANWYRETVAHNTVVVDGRSQDFDVRGSLDAFGVTENLRSVSASVAAPYRTAAEQADVSLGRRLLMTDDYTLDVFDAAGESAHLFDQSWHAEGELQSPAADAPSCGAPGCVLDADDADFGYRHIKVDAEGAVSEWKAEWQTPGATFTVRSLDDEPTTLIDATAPGVASTGDAVDLLLARRDSVSSTRFTNLIDTRSVNDPSVIESAEKVEDGRVRVERTDGSLDEILFTPAGAAVSGSALIRSDADGDVTSIDVIGRSNVARGEESLLEATVDGQPWIIPTATVRRDGSILRVTLSRPADASEPTTVRLAVKITGIEKVEVNGVLQCVEATDGGIDARIVVGDGAEPACQPPGAPRQLTAGFGDGSIELDWQSPASDGGSDVTGYLVQQRTGDSPWKTVATPEETTRTQTGLENGTVYEFRVAAVNAAGVGEWSAVVSQFPGEGLDRIPPEVTIKSGASFTVATGDTYDRISVKLHDRGKVDRVVINGVTKNLTDDVWSDVNYIRPGVFGAVRGENTLIAYDVRGNSTTLTFTLN